LSFPHVFSSSKQLLLFDCGTSLRSDRDLFILKQMASVWIIPFCSVVSCALFWSLAQVLWLGKKNKSMTGLDGFISSLMVLFYTLFPSAVNRIALTFSCQSYGQPATQKSLMTEALSVECYTSEHWTMMTTVGIPGMLVYVIIIPTIIARLLIKQRLALTLYPSQENYQSKWTLRFGFMFAGYKEGYEWWESVVMLRKCLFVLLAIFLKPYGPAPQVVAASLILVVALSAEFQYLPYQDKEHDKIERIGIQACLFQLQMALLCYLIRDQPGTAEDLSSASDMASVGPKTTVVLILVVFGSTLYFFTVTIRATIQGSQETLGVVGSLARRCGDGCGKRSVEEEAGVSLDGGSSRSQTDSRVSRTAVVPITARQQVQQQERQHDAHMYAALKLQQNMRDAVAIRLQQQEASSAQSSEGKLTEEVEDIQKKHAKHRDSHAKKVRTEQIQRRSSVKARVKARNKAKKSNALQKSAVFADMDADSISRIIDAMDYNVLNEVGFSICKQGDKAGVLYLIVSGRCDVVIDGNKVAVLSDLDVFGESALFASGDSGNGAVRGATVTTVTDVVQLLVLPKKKFDNLVASGTLNEDCLGKLRKVAMLRAEENARTRR
jgi:hypothetical protein